jgi:hypothetical protein
MKKLLIIPALFFVASVLNGQIFRDGVKREDGFVSPTNGSTSALSGAAVFTGGSVDVLGFGSVGVMLSTDVAGTMSVQFSIDGTNWDDTHEVSIPTAGSSGAHTYVIPARYMRVVYTNGAAAQGHFRLESILRKIQHSDQHVITSESISKLNDTTLIRESGDFFLDVSRGIISDISVIHLSGFNDDVGTTLEDVWPTGGLYGWSTNSFTVEAISTSGSDTNGGAGARTVLVTGLNASFGSQTETLTMNGVVATAASTGSWVRINGFEVASSGTYATNTITGTQDGDITLRKSSAGEVQSFIEDGSTKFGKSSVMRYSVPANKTAYIQQISVNVDGTKAADIYVWKRENADDVTAPFSPKIVIAEFEGLTGPDTIPFKTPIKLPEKTDFWMSAIVSAGSTKVDAEVEIIVIDD